jgi:cyanophycin synthetase
MTNLADLVTHRAVAAPNETAVIHDDRLISCQTLEDWVWGLCQRLGDSGLAAGSVVGLHLNNPLLHLVALLAAARSGLVSLALEAHGGDTAQGDALLARTGAIAVLTDQQQQGWAVPSILHFDADALKTLAASPNPALRCDQPPGLLHFKTSSGTTGTPKIIGATHAGMITSIEREIRSIGYLPGERYLTPVSMRFDGPRRRYLACLSAGSVAVLPSSQGGGLAELVDTIDRHAVSHFSCVPSQAYELANAMAPGRQRFAAMRCFRLSAGPSEASLHQLVRERLTSHVLVSYGCTELGPMTVATPDLVAAHPQTVGRPMPGVNVQVVTDDGRPLPRNAVGLIRVRVEGMPSAYHDDLEATRRGFRDGWFYPGDLGRLDAQGLLYHMGRADGMMVFDGINIYPAEIEQAMLSHPAVRDAVAMPLKHPVSSDVPVCAVALKGDARPSEMDLLAFARSRLGARRPHRIAVLDRIPRNVHGKVQRPALQQALALRIGAGSVQPPPPARSGDQQTTRRQRALSFGVRFQLSPQADVARIDPWLVQVLGLEPPGIPDAAAPQGHDRAQGWVLRVLLLARWLMQASRVPIFDTPEVLACVPTGDDGQGWRASVLLDRVDELQEHSYSAALQAAFELSTWALEHPLTDEHLQAFYAQAQHHALGEMAPKSPLGESALHVLRVVYQRSIPFTHLGGGVMQLGWGCRARRLEGSVTEGDSAIGARLCANKTVTAAMLRKAGLPAPVHFQVSTVEDASAAARELGWPVVIKPVDRERGEGVAVDVTTQDQLRAAFEEAMALSHRGAVIVERQVDGVCHRLFLARGKLLYGVKRLPILVEGDGQNTVAELLAGEVARQRRLPPWERTEMPPLDAMAMTAIARAGHGPTSVPMRGEKVPLRRIESTAWGGVDEDVSHCIHPENLRAATAAAEIMGLEVAGIDFITTDISRPWFETGSIINEVNFAPLLGGAEISRSHIPTFLDGLIDGNGTIPVDVFIGGDAAWEAAMTRWRQLLSAGVDAFLTCADRTLLPSLQDWPMPVSRLYQRTRALVLCPRAEALVLVVQTDELLSTGLPLEAISSLTVVDQQLQQVAAGGKPASPERVAALLQQLHSWPRWVAPATPS